MSGVRLQRRGKERSVMLRRDRRGQSHGVDVPAERRRYAAANPTRLGMAWRPVERQVNELITTSNPVIRQRVRQLCRDFPPFVRALNVITDYSVGTGLTFHSRVRDDAGEINTRAIRAIETAWARWAEEVDPTGLMDFGMLQGLAKRQDTELGEFLMVLVRPGIMGRFLSIGLRAYEPDWLTSLNARGVDGALLIDDTLVSPKPAFGVGLCQGVEYDRASGAPIAYHLADPSSSLGVTPLRVPAEWVIHGFAVQRPLQMHGISPLVAAVMIAKDISEYMNAEMDAAQMAAKWMAFVETGDAGGWQNLRANEENGKKIEQVENAIIEYLRPGEKINFKDSNRPGSSFEPFVKFVLRLMAIATSTSYELLSGDYSGLSYSNLKAIRNDVIRGFKPHIARHRHQFCRRAQRWFMDFAVLEGRIDLPDYWSLRHIYQRGLWLPPGYESIDPLREGKADREALDSMLRSPQELAASRGRDYEEILDELALAKKWEDERGLFRSQSSSTSKNNPAALGASEEQDADGDARSAVSRASSEEIMDLLYEILDRVDMPGRAIGG